MPDNTCDLGGRDHGYAVATVDGVLEVCADCAFTARDAGFTVDTRSDYLES
jgi:hypothetical protein